MALSDLATELGKTLYFGKDVLKLISPEGILDAKTGAHTHAAPFGMANEHTHRQMHKCKYFAASAHT